MNNKGIIGIWLTINIIFLIIGGIIALAVYPIIAGFFAGGIAGILAGAITLAFIGVCLAIAFVIPGIRMIALGFLLSCFLQYFYYSGSLRLPGV